jgi:rhodanese-related sulfurtransferase
VKDILARAVREGVIVAVIAAVAGLAFNSLRREGIPLLAEPGTYRIETEAEFVKAPEAYRRLEEGTAMFVDVREPELFAREHIEGALNVQAAGGGADSLAWLVSAGMDMIAYADEKNLRQAGMLADRLLEMGFERVFVLYGGLEGWKEKGYPTAAGDR